MFVCVCVCSTHIKVYDNDTKKWYDITEEMLDEEAHARIFTPAFIHECCVWYEIRVYDMCRGYKTSKKERRQVVFLKSSVVS